MILVPNLLEKKSFTETFKGPRLNLYRFYLVILPLGIRCGLMKYHIKPLSMTKLKIFAITSMCITWFYAHRNYVSTSLV